MFGLFRKLTGGKGTAPQNGGVPGRKNTPVNLAPVDLAAWSGLDLPDSKLQNQASRDQIAALARMVRDYFHQHRPAPSSFPALATRVIDMVEQPNVDMNKLVNVIGQDSAISAKVLNVANSAANRRTAEVEDLRACVTLLGLREVANIAVGVAGRSLFDMEARAEFELFAKHWNRLYHQSMTAAFTSGWLALDRNIRSDQAFLGGMFHDIGKSIALRSISALVMGGKIGRCADVVLDGVLEATHVELGVEMHATWKLPQHSKLICQHHHDAAAEAKDEFMDLHLVRVASGLNLLRWGFSEPLAAQVRQSMAVLKLDQRKVRTVGTQISEFSDRVATMFKIPVDPDGPKAQRAPPTPAPARTR